MIRRNIKLLLAGLLVLSVSMVLAGWDDVSWLPYGYPAWDGAKIVHSQDTLIYYYSENNNVFYKYNITRDQWHNLAGIFGGVGVGYCAAYSSHPNGSTILALRGSSDRDCFAYDVAANSWSSETDIPMSDFYVGTGSGMCYAGIVQPGGGTQYAQFYCIKGDGGNGQDNGDNSEFYLLDFDVTPRGSRSNRWVQRSGFPWGNWGIGSCLAYARYTPDMVAPDYTVYALNGGDNNVATHRIYQYYPSADSWVYKSEVGGECRIDEGASMAVAKWGGVAPNQYDTLIYVLTGDHDGEFWSYSTRADVWTELTEPGPQVNVGSCLTAQGNEVWAIFGGSDSLWKWTSDDGGQGGPKGTGCSLPQEFRCQATQIRNGAVFSWSQPLGSTVSLKLFDASGRLVSEPLQNQVYAAGAHELRWNASGAPDGVLFYRLAAGADEATGKITLTD